MSEFQVNGVSYRTRNLNAFEQFHLARKLAPALTLLAAQPDREAARVGFPQAFAALAASLTQEDADGVLRTFLAAAMRRQGDSWAAVAIDGDLMFQDMQDLSVVLQIAWHVIEESRLVDFFAAPRPTSTPGV